MFTSKLIGVYRRTAVMLTLLALSSGAGAQATPTSRPTRVMIAVAPSLDSRGVNKAVVELWGNATERNVVVVSANALNVATLFTALRAARTVEGRVGADRPRLTRFAITRVIADSLVPAAERAQLQRYMQKLQASPQRSIRGYGDLRAINAEVK